MSGHGHRRAGRRHHNGRKKRGAPEPALQPRRKPFNEPSACSRTYGEREQLPRGIHGEGEDQRLELHDPSFSLSMRRCSLFSSAGVSRRVSTRLSTKFSVEPANRRSMRSPMTWAATCARFTLGRYSYARARLLSVRVALPLRTRIFRTVCTVV